MKKLNRTFLVRFAIISALLTQVNHAAYVFENISKTQSMLDTGIAYMFAASLELSTYIFTISQKRRIATFFAVVAILINLLYYWQGGVWDFHFWASITISCILPFSIWQYSDLVHSDIKKSEKQAGEPTRKKKKRKKPVQLQFFNEPNTQAV
ncbi:hypothetical protein ACFOW1_09605 [Parasediminibacterium paludis]|uniref:DoxX-like protein n=1 Tax=Parasediminibacterium paludis TaxID=908966 RepID=A0ABV8PXK1_9BACT